MNAMDIKEEEYLTLWTRQVSEILGEIKDYGVYKVKEEYIRKKNDTISDYYLKLYKWFTDEAKKYVDVKGEYPIWLSVADEFRLRPVEDTVTLKLRVPSKEVLLCNYDAWGYTVNYFYVPLDEADKARHKEELTKNGLVSDDELFLTSKGNFYPLLKREVVKSWERIFTLKPTDLKACLVAVTWEIKKEWIEEVEYYEG
jgi:hypothetical protein